MSFVTEFWYEKYEVGGRDSRKGSSKLYLRVFSPHFLTFVIMTISTFFSPFSYFLYHNTCKTTKPTIMFSVEKYNLGMNLVKYAFNISSKKFWGSLSTKSEATSILPKSKQFEMWSYPRHANSWRASWGGSPMFINSSRPW